MKTKTIILSVILAVNLAACKKDINSTTNSGLDFQLRAVNPNSTVGRVMATVKWDSGFVNANQIKFEAKQNGNETEFKSKVLQHVDLFSSTSTVGNIHIPAGTFDEVEFKAETAPTSTEPAVKLQGSVNGTPLVFVIDITFEIKSEQSRVTLDGSDIALNKIDLSGLTAGLSFADFTNATQTNGVIVISSASNTSLFNTILSNLQKQGETEVEVHHH